ncbi:MAG: calcium/sodium antiporter [Bacillota bacterium]|jgi:cation:H+ antiporter
MILAVGLFVLGLFLIIKGGDWFVEAAGWLAEISGIPRVIIGATVVSIATTLPELLVSLFAALDGKVAMAVGNAVGSVNANIGLIMAVSLIWAPSVFRRKTLAVKALMMLAACILLWFFTCNGLLSLGGSLILLLLFFCFIGESVRGAKKSREPALQLSFTRTSVWGNVGKFVFGAAAIVVGAQLLVDNGSQIALYLGVSEAVIGVTIVAVGTSLPELVTAITSLVKKQADLSVGNIIGANIIDLTMILPLCALVSGGQLPVSRQSVILDMPVSILLVILAVLPPLFFGRFRQSQGLLLLLLYIAYILVVSTGYVLVFL